MTTVRVSPECPSSQHYVPRSLCQRIMQRVHTSLISGHPAIQQTIELLCNSFWWPNLHNYVTVYVKSCSVCVCVLSPKHTGNSQLVFWNLYQFPQHPWSHLDFITNLPSSNGHSTILLIIDRFSKACRLIPLKGLPTAMETAQALFHQGGHSSHLGYGKLSVSNWT